MRKRFGFTLLEIILVFAILGISSAFIAPIYFSTKNKDDLDNKTDIIVSSLRRAQSLAMTGYQDSSWGLKILENDIVVFMGEDYINRDPGFDDIVSVNKNINRSGLDEVVFLKNIGNTNNFGSINLSISNFNREIIINKKGIIEY
jgi:prepilin-type N-terminal cleavage/methylation domain-containing protein